MSDYELADARKRAREYRRAVDAAARFMELIEPRLDSILFHQDKETNKKLQGLARILMNKFIHELSDITPTSGREHLL